MLREEHVIAAAHLPLSLRRQLVEHARESDRTLSGEIRRGLAYYAAREYGRTDERDDRNLSRT
jgi:hypothetical protein